MFLTATGHRLNINSRGNFQPSLRVDLDDPHFRSEKSNEGLQNILALKRGCLPNCSALALNQCVYQRREPVRGVFDCGPLAGILSEILQC
jgi:hypothetical protein